MSAATFDQLSEWPLATRDECWRAYRPAQPFSESAFQRLRREALVSAGIRMQPRRHGRVHGQGRYFSRLNLLALNAYRLGDEHEARNLASRATEIEATHEVQDLVKLLDIEKSGDASAESSSPRLKLLLAQVCKITDSISDESHGSPTRLPAIVRKLRDGFADLALKDGETIIFSEVKLSSIVRDSPGAIVYLYMIDLGDADELIRARPGVEVESVAVDDSVLDVDLGVFERAVTTVTGYEADLLEGLLAAPARTRPSDLTGLRVVR